MKRFLAAAALAPLSFAAGLAHAETTVATSTTTPVTTATIKSGAPDDVHVTTAGSISPTTAGTAAVTLNSNNNVINDGQITYTDLDNVTGILIQGGYTGNVTNNGTISLTDSTTATDTNGDGIVDGAFASKSGLYGIRLVGPGSLTGNITNAGSITVKGNDSAGISVESGLIGNLVSSGSVVLTGHRGFGIHSTGPITGAVTISGAVVVNGQNSVGVSIDNSVSGTVSILNAISATGYRSTTRPIDTSILAKLTADELLQGGPAVWIKGSVGGGVRLDALNTTTDTTTTTVSVGSISVFGSAPALLVGDTTGATTLGVVGTGDNAYGIVLNGAISSLGVYDGVSATGVQIGGLGGTVNVAGGIRLGAYNSAIAQQADSTLLRIGAGATVPTINNLGTISALTYTGGTSTATGVAIDAGASVTTLTNSGDILATISGAKGNATAVSDKSGTLRTVTNTGSISAVVVPTNTADTVTGRSIALDLRANTAGVTVTQSANTSTTTITPSITGDVLFGSGDAHLNLLAGTLTGAVAFGSGNDTLVIDNGAKMRGALTDAGGGLSINVANGMLDMTNLATLNLNTLAIGASGQITFVGDAATGQATRFNVAGTATIGSGAKIGLSLNNKLSNTTTFTVIQAGSLSVGSPPTLLGDVPWLYRGTLNANTTTGTVSITLRRASVDEVGVSAGGRSAFESFFTNFDRDAAVSAAVLGQTTQAGFNHLYNQFLPDYSGGLFETLETAAEAAGRAQAEEPTRVRTDAPRAWLQEIGFGVTRDTDAYAGYRSAGFGFVGGIEQPNTDAGALGVAAAVMNANVNDPDAFAGDTLNGTVMQLGLYWRGANASGFHADASISGGYAFFNSKRVIVDTSTTTVLQRTSKAHWNGAVASARLGLNYEHEMGRYYIRPEAVATYFLMYEGDRQEHGGGGAVDLAVSSRTSQQIAAEAVAAFGARYGDQDFRWGPELKLGYRAVLSGGPDDTVARFLAGGSSFTLTPGQLDKGGAVVRFAMRGEGQYGDYALEAGATLRKSWTAYYARAAARFVF